MKEEAAAEWRKLHTEEFHSFYSSPNIIPTIAKKRIWAGHVARTGWFIKAWKILVRNSAGKKLIM